MRGSERMLMGVVLAWLCAPPAMAAVTAAPGWAVRRLPTPGVVAGGVVRDGDALVVGQGDFGPGLQSIVRIEAGQAVTIATGFGGLGGFDLAEDGTLYVVDNCFDGDFGCDGATTGDTVYAIPDALTRTTPLAAADAALLPAGSIPFAYDVLATPAGLLVSDAVGPGEGRVVRVDGGVVPLVTGLDFAGGLAFDDPSLYVANVVYDMDFNAAGSILEYDATGSPLGAVVDALAGAGGLAVDDVGDLLVTGGSADDGSGTVLAVDAAGDAEERARGFTYSGDVFYDPARGDALVLDFGDSAVTALCADEDGDGVCDADCSDALAFDRVALVVKGGKPGKGSLALKGRLHVDGGLFSEPADDGLRLEVVDATGLVVLDAAIPGGDGWRTKRKGRGWTYRAPDEATAVTAVDVSLSRRDDALVKVAVRSKKRLTVDPGALAQPLQALVVFDPDLECAATHFAGCRGSGKKVRCR